MMLYFGCLRRGCGGLRRRRCAPDGRDLGTEGMPRASRLAAARNGDQPSERGGGTGTSATRVTLR